MGHKYLKVTFKTDGDKTPRAAVASSYQWQQPIPGVSTSAAPVALPTAPLLTSPSSSTSSRTPGTSAETEMVKTLAVQIVANEREIKELKEQLAVAHDEIKQLKSERDELLAATATGSGSKVAKKRERDESSGNSSGNSNGSSSSGDSNKATATSPTSGGEKRSKVDSST
jgi:hypothetical protein